MAESLAKFDVRTLYAVTIASVILLWKFAPIALLTWLW